jgi:hypothetical protein
MVIGHSECPQHDHRGRVNEENAGMQECRNAGMRECGNDFL